MNLTANALPGDIDSPYPPLRGVPTRQGVLYVPWNLDCVQALLRNLSLSPGDLEPDHDLYQPFLRHLFMLATLEAMRPGAERCVRDLVRAVRCERRTD